MEKFTKNRIQKKRNKPATTRVVVRTEEEYRVAGTAVATANTQQISRSRSKSR
jgi:hypothetical protein